MSSSRPDHHHLCAVMDGESCDCWMAAEASRQTPALVGLLCIDSVGCLLPMGHEGKHEPLHGERRVPSCSCGSIALYNERPPRFGPHHQASCLRYRDRDGNPVVPHA